MGLIHWQEQLPSTSINLIIKPAGSNFKLFRVSGMVHPSPVTLGFISFNLTYRAAPAGFDEPHRVEYRHA
ncbi:hypothetical protein NTGM5_140013 [Candidatus Nitrotoga sp. M5]|nr:hypothetical protein NTGM5_140013 [Candidatus Nitrotoga sp. M5]